MTTTPPPGALPPTTPATPVPYSAPVPSGSGSITPVTQPALPDQIVTTVIQEIRNWSHAAGTFVGFLMLLAYGVTQTLHALSVDISGADWRIGAVGAGIIGLSQAIDSWNSVNQTATAVNAGQPTPAAAVVTIHTSPGA